MSAQPPAKPNKISREIEISEWKPRLKNTLRGFFTATLPSGMVIHNLSLHEKDQRRWVNMPSRSYEDSAGQVHYEEIIEFDESKTEDRFREETLKALDGYFAALTAGKEKQ